MNEKHYLDLGLVLVVVVALGVYALGHYPSKGSIATSPPASTSAEFYCAQGATIGATFGASSVQLALSDGRVLTLPQTVSGSGIRYEATTSPSTGSGQVSDIVFASEGANATLTENNQITYDECVAAKIQDLGNGTDSYTDQSNTFTFAFPGTFLAGGVEMGYSTSWMYNATTTGLELAVVTTPADYLPGTNFAQSRFTVGVSSDPSALAECLQPVAGETAKGSVTINGVAYQEFTGSDAGAGNFYQTTSYRTVRAGECYAVEYTIHSTNIGNYPPSAGIKAFDASAVQATFEAIARSFTFN